MHTCLSSYSRDLSMSLSLRSGADASAAKRNGCCAHINGDEANVCVCVCVCAMGQFERNNSR